MRRPNKGFEIERLPVIKSLGEKFYRFFRYGNRRARLYRVVNLLELRLRREKLLTHPPFLSIDPAPFCNLRCLCCPTGGNTSQLSCEPLEPDTFQRIMRNIRVDRLAHASLYRLGEPLLNKHLCDYIRYFSERRIYTTISVNFSARDYDDDYMRALIESGLSEMAVSVDGTTQETYEKYRVGGDLSRVLGNMRRLADVKKRLKAATPRVICKMLLNKFNQHQVDDARRVAAELDAEFYQPHFFWTPDDAWVADKFRAIYDGKPQSYVLTDDRHRYIDTECRQLWDTLHVHSNGDVLPCCMAVEHKFAVGNLTTDHIDTIWNGDKMRAMRRYVVNPAEPAPPFDNMCMYCSRRFCTYWNK